MDVMLNETKHLKKHADLILCSNPMSLIQRKIFNVLLFHALPRMQNTILFEIPIRDICLQIGYTSRNYVPLVNAIETITQLSIRWRVVDTKTKLEDIISDTIAVITRVTIEKGICYYKYNDDIKLKLARPGMYGKIDLKIQSAIASSFGLVLYELSEKFKKIGYTPWFTMEQLRELMGVKKNAYKSFYDFEKNVIIKAVHEVNSKSNLQVDFLKKKKGKIVSEVKFIILINNNCVETNDCNHQIDNDLGDLSDNQIILMLIKDFGMTTKEAIKIWQKYSDEENFGKDYIENKITLTKKSTAYLNGNIKNLAGFIVQALKNNYQILPTQKELINEQYREKIREEKNKRDALTCIENQEKEYKKYIHNKVREYTDSISKEELNVLKLGFKDYCTLNNKEYVLEYYQDGKGIDRAMVRPVFNSYVISSKLERAVLCKEDFLKNSNEVLDINADI